MNNNPAIFDGLIVFCAVVENEGFTAAARTLGHTPSHVSKEIARLEERLGVRLLNRTTRSVSLTDAGGRYYERARQIVEDARRAQDQIMGAASTPSGLLNISVPVSLSLSCLNAWLPEFLSCYPDIRLAIETSDRMVDIVGEGFDVVVRAGSLDDSDLVARRLSTSRLLIVASPDYLERAGMPKKPEDLVDHVLIDFAHRDLAGRWRFSYSDGRRLSIPVSPRVVCNSGETEEALAIAGVGITRLPSFICQRAIDSGRLIPILEPFENPPVGIYAIYPSRLQLAPKVRAFVDFLIDKFNDWHMLGIPS